MNCCWLACSGGNRRDGFRAVVVGIAVAADNGDGIVAVEAEAAGLLVEAQPVVLEVEQQRLVEGAALEGRRGRRHLQAREGLALEPQAHDLDVAQRFRAAVRLDRAVEHDPCLFLRAFGEGLDVLGGGDRGGNEQDGGNGGAQHGALRE